MMTPTRVVIDEKGYAVSPEAAKKLGITWDVIYVREDGWSLGAPDCLSSVAHSLWSDLWVDTVRVKDD
ncbi:MAG: hypothetical protein DRP01_00020 [Archaeoglobales archaeon]|nr:MAG: hypothetical protein DRP01_00020 [Archaeoglobales archaeon]